MEPALTNRIIHSHPAPGCTGRVYRTEYTASEWASGDIFPADIRDRIHVNPIAFYDRHRATEGAAA